MPTRLPELSYRLAHHFPDALPFIIPFYNKLTAAGFEIDEKHIKPVLRRKGRRIVTDHGESSVTFHLFGEKSSIATVDLRQLLKKIQSVKKVADYRAVDNQIAQLVELLKKATD
jgi:hypothetical protein